PAGAAGGGGRVGRRVGAPGAGVTAAAAAAIRRERACDRDGRRLEEDRTAAPAAARVLVRGKPTDGAALAADGDRARGVDGEHACGGDLDRSAPGAASDRAAAARGTADERANRGTAIRRAACGLPAAKAAH